MMQSSTIVRALVVEDDRVWQQILGEILADTGLTVDVAPDLETAVSMLRGAPYRLAVADLALSDSDHHNQEGLRVLDAVRDFAPGCVTILLTGYATVELAVSVLTEHGAYTCLRKETFNRRQFRELVQRALTSPRSPSTANIAESGQGVTPLALTVEGAAVQAERLTPRANGELDALTEREREVLELVAKGMTNKEIAGALVITPNTVKRHLKAIFEKLGIHTRAAAAAKAIGASAGEA